jgi:hypothetical protein
VRRIGVALSDLCDRAERDPAGVGLGVVHLATLLDDLEDPRGHPRRIGVRALADVAKRGGVEAEPLDRDLELVRPNRPIRIEPLGRLGQSAGRSDNPIGTEPLNKRGGVEV